MGILKKGIDIIFKEGIINYINRKQNKTFLDSKTTFTINYRNRKTKIALNRKFGHVDLMIFKHGIYEKDIVDSIFDELNPEMNFIDIGSNIGQHSLLLAPYCKNVYAFEPISMVYEQFKRSIELNQYKNIHTYNVAISNKQEEKTFNFVQNHAGTSSFVERENPTSTTIKVKTDTLENILTDVKMDVVKIDVEGYEAVVILGNREKFLKDKPVIFMEYNPDWMIKEGNYHPKELIDFFSNNQYQIFSRNQNRILTAQEIDFEIQDNWVVKHTK